MRAAVRPTDRPTGVGPTRSDGRSLVAEALLLQLPLIPRDNSVSRSLSCRHTVHICMYSERLSAASDLQRVGLAST